MNDQERARVLPRRTMRVSAGGRIFLDILRREYGVQVNPYPDGSGQLPSVRGQVPLMCGELPWN